MEVLVNPTSEQVSADMVSMYADLTLEYAEELYRLAAATDLLEAEYKVLVSELFDED